MSHDRFWGLSERTSQASSLKAYICIIVFFCLKAEKSPGKIQANWFCFSCKNIHSSSKCESPLKLIWIILLWRVSCDLNWISDGVFWWPVLTYKPASHLISCGSARGQAVAPTQVMPLTMFQASRAFWWAPFFCLLFCLWILHKILGKKEFVFLQWVI